MRCKCLIATSTRAAPNRPPALAAFAAGALLSLLYTSAHAQGSTYAGHAAWGAYHVTGLPEEIRIGVLKRQRGCGAPLAATHFFALTTNVGLERFISLHFENLWCPNTTAVCRADDCLHEVYASAGGRYRLVYSAYVRDMRITKDGAAGLIIAGSTSDVLQWNGQRFVAIRGKGAE